MPSVLTVDDSRAVRMLVSKNAREMGLEVEEAEDGKQGLIKLETTKYDLIVLDVTMPELDGPGMLTELRARGDTTPVLMLTSESKRSIVASLMKLSIEGYILKPFKPDELKAKIAKALRMDAPSGADAALAKEMAAVVQTPSAGEAKGIEAGKQFVDILCVDDMENVAKRLRTMIPEHITLNNATSAQAALATCRERVFRILLIDNDMPDVDSASLMRQLRIMQPGAAFLSLSLRNNAKAQEEARENGFAGVVFKPFDAEAIEEFLQRYFDSQEVITKSDSVITVAAFKGRETRLAGYFSQVTNLLSESLEEVAAACFAEAVVDISATPLVPEKTARLVVHLVERCRKVGVELRLVGGAEVARSLKQLADTADLKVFASVAEAQVGVAA
jgi:CheY-like chemotaxis protein/anti-anti-sigma regulatory factor